MPSHGESAFDDAVAQRTTLFALLPNRVTRATQKKSRPFRRRLSQVVVG